MQSARFATCRHGKVLPNAFLDRADLTGADLRGADLSGAFLGGAILEDANLIGPDLRDADLCAAATSLAYYRVVNEVGACRVASDRDFNPRQASLSTVAQRSSWAKNFLILRMLYL